MQDKARGRRGNSKRFRTTREHKKPYTLAVYIVFLVAQAATHVLYCVAFPSRGSFSQQSPLHKLCSGAKIAVKSSRTLRSSAVRIVWLAASKKHGRTRPPSMRDCDTRACSQETISYSSVSGAHLPPPYMRGVGSPLAQVLSRPPTPTPTLTRTRVCVYTKEPWDLAPGTQAPTGIPLSFSSNRMVLQRLGGIPERASGSTSGGPGTCIPGR